MGSTLHSHQQHDEVVSEIKENIKTSLTETTAHLQTLLTGTAAHLQQLVKEQSCGKKGYENMVGGVQVNKINDSPNSKHVYSSLYSQTTRTRRQQAHDKRTDWWNHRNPSAGNLKLGITISWIS